MISKKHIRDKNFILRLTKEEDRLIKMKSLFCGQKSSALARDAIWSYWPNDDFNPDKLLKEYQTTDNKSDLVQLLVSYFRRVGYPYAKMDTNDLRKEMCSLVNTKSPLLDNNHLQSNTIGLRIANYFHPHMMKVHCLSKYRSPDDVFKDDALLHDAINRWLELGYKPTLSGIRRILRTRDGVRSVVNFKPAIAKYIYDKYCPMNGLALDPCAGYGGRLAGAIAANKGIFYHGIDPYAETAIGNMKLAGFYNSQYEGLSDKPIWNFKFRFDLGCAEDVMPGLVDKYDLIFTSPPYYNVERYSEEPNQSYKRYPEYSLWRDQFLFVLVKESKRVCREGGHVILNVKNYKDKKIADDVLIFAEQVGLKLIKTYDMRLANSEYHRDGIVMYHTEPIYVFQC